MSSAVKDFCNLLHNNEQIAKRYIKIIWIADIVNAATRACHIQMSHIVRPLKRPDIMKWLNHFPNPPFFPVSLCPSLLISAELPGAQPEQSSHVALCRGITQHALLSTASSFAEAPRAEPKEFVGNGLGVFHQCWCAVWKTLPTFRVYKQDISLYFAHLVIRPPF